MGPPIPPSRCILLSPSLGMLPTSSRTSYLLPVGWRAADRRLGASLTQRLGAASLFPCLPSIQFGAFAARELGKCAPYRASPVTVNCVFSTDAFGVKHERRFDQTYLLHLSSSHMNTKSPDTELACAKLAMLTFLENGHHTSWLTFHPIPNEKSDLAP